VLSDDDNKKHPKFDEVASGNPPPPPHTHSRNIKQERCQNFSCGKSTNVEKSQNVNRRGLVVFDLFVPNYFMSNGFASKLKITPDGHI
jgi:hypothetical protein